MLLKSQTPGCGGSAECFLFKMPQGSTEPESSPLLQAMQGQREETGRSAEGGWCRSGSGSQSTGGGFPESHGLRCGVGQGLSSGPRHSCPMSTSYSSGTGLGLAKLEHPVSPSGVWA